MKKIAVIIAVLLALAGIAIFVLLPKEFRLEIPSQDLQKKAGEKFPQIMGKAIKLEMPSPSQSSQPSQPPGLPKPPGAPKLPERPQLHESPLPEYILMGITLHTPTLTLSEGTLHIAFDRMDLRVTGTYLFGFTSSSQLPHDSEYQRVEQGLRKHFSDKHALTDEATIKKSGKDTWLVQDGSMEYTLAKEEGKTQVFATRQGGTDVRGVSSKAQAKISGELQYEPEAHTVFFQSVEVHEFTIEKLAQLDVVPADIVQELVKNQVNTVLKEEQRIPVADLKDTAEEQEPKLVRVLSKLFLKDVVIVEDKVTIILSLKK